MIPFILPPMCPFQTISHSYIRATHEDEPVSFYTPSKPQNVHLSAGENRDDNNRFVFPRRGSGALQLAGNDKYLHAGPREGQAAAALLSQTGSCSDEASVLLICCQ